MKPEEIRRRLEAQEWRCCYPCEEPNRGGKIEPGDEVALCFDGHGLCHVRCAKVGVAPEPARLVLTFRGEPHGDERTLGRVAAMLEGPDGADRVRGISNRLGTPWTTLHLESAEVT